MFPLLEAGDATPRARQSVGYLALFVSALLLLPAFAGGLAAFLGPLLPLLLPLLLALLASLLLLLHCGCSGFRWTRCHGRRRGLRTCRLRRWRGLRRDLRRDLRRRLRRHRGSARGFPHRFALLALLFTLMLPLFA
jgi:hypothetical protein